MIIYMQMKLLILLSFIAGGFFMADISLADLREYTQFSYSQIHPRRKGEIKFQAQLANSKNKTGDFSSNVKDTYYNVDASLKLSPLIYFGLEHQTDATKDTHQNPNLVNETAYDIIETDSSHARVGGFTKFRIPLQKANLYLSYALHQSFIEEGITTKSFSQTQLTAREKTKTSFSYNQSRFGVGYSQGIGMFGLDFVPSVKVSNEASPRYEPREYQLFARVNVLNNMQLAVAVGQNVYDNLDPLGTRTYRDYNTYKLATRYWWKNKKVYSMIQAKDSPLVNTSGYMDIKADIYFGFKSSSSLDLGAKFNYKYLRYAENDVYYSRISVGMGIEANFII